MQWRGLQETRAMLGIYIRLKIALNCFRICYIELLLVGKVFEKAVYKVLEHVSRQREEQTSSVDTTARKRQ